MTRHRRGASLIELLVAISIISVIMGLVGMLLHRLLRSEHIANRAALLELTTSRLANQFRSDAHAAQTIQQAVHADGDRTILELKHDSTTVVYTATAGKLERDVVNPDGTTLHDAFRLPDCRVTFSESKSGHSENAATLVSLQIERPHATSTASTPAPKTLRLMTIVAELNRDRRLSASVTIAARPSNERTP